MNCSTSHDPSGKHKGGTIQALVKKIGIFGFFGYGNLGNAAIQDAMIENICRYYPGAEIFGFSLNPEDTQKRHGIISYPIVARFGQTTVAGQFSALPPAKRTPYEITKTWLRKAPRLFSVLKALKRPLDYLEYILKEAQFWRSSYNILKNIDLFIVSGGGALDDFWGGPWSHPYTIFKWAVMARFAGSRLVVVSVGAERLQSRWSRFFVRTALSLASYRSYRDQESKALIEKVGVRGKNHVFPDLAFSLKEKYASCGCKLGDRFRGLVAIGPMAYLDPRSWPKKDSDGYVAYVRKVTDFTAWLIEHDFSVCLFPSEIYMDYVVIQDVIEAIKQRGLQYGSDQLFENAVSTVKDLLQQLATADFVVASRLHGVILSHVVGTPVIAVSYDPKVERVMRNLGLSDYCLNIDSFTSTSLAERFRTLESNSKAIRKLVAARTAEYRGALARQYDFIFKVDGQGHTSGALAKNEQPTLARAVKIE